ncbi:MAG: S1 RNA-binding domain-containing protein [Fimbriimonas sp.]
MTIDHNQTPVGTEDAHNPVENAAGAASDASEVAATAAPSTPDAPAPVSNDEVAPLPATEAQDEAPVATDPQPEPDTTSLPGSEPHIPSEQPPVPADPTPAAPSPEPAPATPGEPATPAPAPATPQGEAATAEAPAAPAAPAKPGMSDADLFDSYMSGEFNVDGDPMEGGFKRLAKGERVSATIVQVDRDKVFVQLPGSKAEGIVPLGELSEENLETAKGHFNVGDKINVVVIRPEGAEGNPIVSKKRAEFEEAWDRIEEAHRTQETINAQVVDRVKGGLVVDVGVRGFVPATHVGSGKLRNIEKFVGNPLSLKVIEIDRDRKKVVLSNRQAEEERRASAKEDIFSNVKPGDRLSGTVRRLTDYGAFVDLGGVDGLLHISEMSWARINHPKEMFKEGQKIEVMVLRLDPSAGKISLGHRQVLPDPWNLIKDNYKVGQTLKVIINRIVQSGAFIRLPEGAEAFMPVSEMSFRRIKRPQDVVEENQEVEAQIIDLRPDERRMVLSMRALGGGGELRPGAGQYQPSGFEEDLRRAAGGGPKGKKGPGGKKGRGGRDDDFGDFGDDFGARRGFATGGATIGERLGMLKGFLGRDDDETEEKESDGDGDSSSEE